VIPGIMTPPPLARVNGASYVGGQFGFNTSGTLASKGALANDLLIVYDPVGSGSVTLSGGGALTSITNNFYYRKLGSGDLSSTVTASGSGASLVIYRGASTAAVVDTDSSAGAATSRDAGGFVKNASHAGIVAVIHSVTVGATVSISSPPVFTQRGNVDAGIVAARTMWVGDRLYPTNVTYINSASVIWNSSGSSNIYKLVELRS